MRRPGHVNNSAGQSAVERSVTGRNLTAGRLVTWLNLGAWVIAVCFYMSPGFVLQVWSPKGWLFLSACAAFGLLSCWLWFRFVIFSRRFGQRGQIVASVAGLIVVMLAAAVASGLLNQKLFHMTIAISNTVRALPLYYAVINNWLLFGWVYLVFGGGVAAILSMFAAQEHERNLALAREAAQAAQLAALRLQITPHFLFNTLNAVSELITEDRKTEAELIVARLSDLFRAALTEAPSELVPLHEELDVVGFYLDIEKTRFGDRLTFDIDLPPDLRDALIPPFLLQPLVENASKHAVAPSKGPVTVQLRAYRQDQALVLSVSDHGEPVIGTQPGLGVGLSNVAARLEALYGDAGRLEAGPEIHGFVARVTLPLQFAGSDHRRREVVA